MSWALFAMTAANMWLVSEKRRSGFLVGLVAQPLWMVFDLYTGAYGLLPLAPIMSLILLRGWWKWSQDERASEPPEST